VLIHKHDLRGKVPTRKIPMSLIIILVCVAVSPFITLATYNLTRQEAIPGGPTTIYHGWPLHWMMEIHPPVRPIPGPVLPTFIFETANFLINTLIYAILFTTTLLFLHTKTHQFWKQTPEEKKAIEEKDEITNEKELRLP
jgi:hypothetical protein